jgi:hypothetical protein
MLSFLRIGKNLLQSSFLKAYHCHYQDWYPGIWAVVEGKPCPKGAACCCVKENQCCKSTRSSHYVFRSVNWLNPLVKLIWGYWCQQLDLSVCLPRCDSTRKSTFDIPLVARIVYCLIQILKVACLTKWRVSSRAARNIPNGLAPKPMLSKAFLNWVHGKNELADILGYGSWRFK